jgi:hypothetical protein
MSICRDVFFARARGVELGAIHSHVTARHTPSGTPSRLTPTQPNFSGPRHPNIPTVPRRSLPSPTNATTSISSPVAPMKDDDIRIVFQNLEEVASFAEAFAGVLDGARGALGCDEEGLDDQVFEDEDDRIGEAFLEMVIFVLDFGFYYY